MVNEDELNRILDHHVRKRIKEICFSTPNYFSEFLRIEDMLPFVKPPFMPQGSWETLERIKDREGNARSINAFLDTAQRHRGFGLRFLEILVDTNHGDVATEIFAGLDDRWLPPTRYDEFLERHFRPRRMPSPPAYSVSMGMREDQEEKFQNFSSASSAFPPGVDDPPPGYVFQRQTLSSSPLEGFSGETPVSQYTSAMRMNIAPSGSVQPTNNLNIDDGAVGGIPLQTPPASLGNPTSEAPNILDQNMSQPDTDIRNDDTAAPPAQSNDMSGYPFTTLTPPRQQTNLATVAETTVNYPNSAAGKIQNAGDRSARPEENINIIRPSGDVSDKFGDSSDSSFCISEPRMEDRDGPHQLESETVPKEILVAVSGDSPSAVTNDSEEDITGQSAVNIKLQEKEPEFYDIPDVSKSLLCISDPDTSVDDSEASQHSETLPKEILVNDNAPSPSDEQHEADFVQKESGIGENELQVVNGGQDHQSSDENPPESHEQSGLSNGTNEEPSSSLDTPRSQRSESVPSTDKLTDLSGQQINGAGEKFVPSDSGYSTSSVEESSEVPSGEVITIREVPIQMAEDSQTPNTSAVMSKTMDELKPSDDNNNDKPVRNGIGLQQAHNSVNLISSNHGPVSAVENSNRTWNVVVGILALGVVMAGFSQR